MASRFLNNLKSEFRHYNLQSFFKDLLAGLTVAAVALPLALAFDVSSGADAAAGLITAIIAGIFISALSGASFQISGPTGAMAAILISIISRYRMEGVFLVTLLAGFFLLLAGLLKIGKIIRFIPRPVITGFTSGIALVIALGQIDSFFGVKSEGENILQRLLSYARLGFPIQWQVLLIAAFVILVMILWPKKLNSIIPSSLAGLILATLVSIILKLDIPTIGAIPKTLFPEVRLRLDWNLIKILPNFVSPALSIAALGMVESLLCGSSALRMKPGSTFDADQELIAQGLGNMIIPFFGGIPATAAIARTSVAIKSGNQTRLTGVFHAVILLASMFLLGPIIAQVPYAALAGVLMVTAWRMNEWPAIKNMFGKRQISAILKYLVTLAATVVFDLTIAIVIGVAFAALIFIANSAKLDVSSSRVKNELLYTSGGDVEAHHSNATVIYIGGPIFFGNAERLSEQVYKELTDSEIVIFSMRGVPTIDITGTEVLLDLVKTCQKRGLIVIFSELSQAARLRLDSAGLADLIGKDCYFPSVDRALLTITEDSRFREQER
ncbi:MAG: SulP family inorganic anion transporter [Clostridiaceae bacterium]|nr:SulP family inorganic anion transporter [Clostridiaceae bacterium]